MTQEVKRNYLEINSLKDLNERFKPSGNYSLNLVKPNNFQLNKFFYKNIGKKHKWVDRLIWTDQQWIDYIHNPKIKTYVLKKNSEFAGFFELIIHEDKNEVEIAYLGLLEEYQNQKLGSHLLSSAIKNSFLSKPKRVWVHTCSLDHQNALINYNKKLSNINGELRPGIVHRIDKDTSGLVVVAKNNFVHENLSNQFSEHSVDRQYQTLIWGKLRPSKGKIETLITRSSKNRQLMSVSLSKGKKSITNYKTLEIFEKDTIPTFSLVECKLETGRTHQIRVHMSYKGNNIVGDQKYKKKFKKIKNINLKLEEKLTNLKRQFLHAKTIGFIHPKKNKEMIFNSILPQELEIILKMLRNTSK